MLFIFGRQPEPPVFDCHVAEDQVESDQWLDERRIPPCSGTDSARGWNASTARKRSTAEDCVHPASSTDLDADPLLEADLRPQAAPH